VNYSNVIIATGCDNINSKTQNQGAQIGIADRAVAVKTVPLTS
jgi:hypothetical protein